MRHPHGLRAASADKLLEFVALSTATIDSTTLTINKPTGTVQGNLLIAIMFSDSLSNATWTGDTGWTEVIDQGVRPSLRVAYKVAGASEASSYTFISNFSGLIGGAILTYKNALYDTIGAIQTGASGDVQTAPSITLAESASTLIAVFARGQTTSWSAPSAGLSLLTTQTVVRPAWAIYHQVDLPSGSTGTRQATPANTAGALACVLIGIKPS
jgi:hypothetical protein